MYVYFIKFFLISYSYLTKKEIFLGKKRKFIAISLTTNDVYVFILYLTI